MKKMFVVVMSIALATFNITSHAQETVEGATTTNSQNKHAGSANTTSDNKPTSAKIDTNKQLREHNEQENDGSLYDNIRYGWNKFIDFLAGPKQSQ